VERRFALFLVLTVLMWTGFLALRMYLAPPQPPVAEQAEDAKQEEPKKGEKKAEEAPKKPEVEPARPKVAAPDAAKNAREWVTIGSADPASGFGGLYYFDSQGAAVETVELNGKRYKSVEDQGGYLARLAPSPAAEGGAEVHVVGAGTPAALAKAAGNVAPGLAVGDVIKSIDGVAISSGEALEEYLKKKTHPGERVLLRVVRSGVKEPIEFTAVLARWPVAVVKKEPREVGGVIEYDPLSLLVTLESIGSARADEKDERGLFSLAEANWKVENRGEDFVEFSYTLSEEALAAHKIEHAGPIKIVKRYSVAKAQKAGEPDFHLDMQIAIHNQSDQPLREVSYRLQGPTGLPLEGWWYSTKLNPNWGGAGARDVVYEQTGLGHQLVGCPKLVSDARQAAKDKKLWPGTKLRQGETAAAFDYAGVDTQFFASIIQPQKPAGGQEIKFMSAFGLPVHDVTLLSKTRLRTADVTVRLTTNRVEIKPQGALTHDYRVFFGPKEPHVLAAYGLDPLIEYGWPIFAVPAKFLRYVLNGLYWLTGLVGLPNYGIAIILLTVIVRSCMIPVSLKQARSAAKMQELAPEIQKIKDKFPDDPMKQHQAVQELYKKHDFNMFGGCLPVFIQLPIFIGLYRCLSVDFDLRDAPLLSEAIHWASNLAGPDKLFYWKDWMPAFIADEADGWLGPYFNVFPLITVTLFLIQQKMFTPPATDEQTRMQQQMMTYMTVFMGVMFYKVPAGLCLYFITSSLWGICERKLLPKPKPKEAGAAVPAKPVSGNGAAKAGAKRSKQKR
jgi:YidC/Oxa1 family membrane protein insertase